MENNEWKSVGTEVSAKEKKYLKWQEVYTIEIIGTFIGKEERDSVRFPGTKMYTFLIESEDLIFGLPSFTMLAKKFENVEVGSQVKFEFLEKHARGYRCNLFVKKENE